MTIRVTGVGWVTGEGYGCVATGEEHRFAQGEGVGSLGRAGLFSHPFRNFSRLDLLSKMTVCAVALALRDAAIPYSPAEKQETGILGSSGQGSMASDLAYFSDYVGNGRTLSRANLFIYTLPSSPLGEAAIHFGLVGPLLYASGAAGAGGAILDMAAGVVAAGEAERMLCGRADPGEALYLVLERDRDKASGRTLADARTIVASGRDVAGMVHEFSLVKDTKGEA